MKSAAFAQSGLPVIDSATLMPLALASEIAVSICSSCYQKVEAKIVFEDGKVFMLKHCFQHGHERVLIADDIDYCSQQYRGCGSAQPAIAAHTLRRA